MIKRFNPEKELRKIQGNKREKMLLVIIFLLIIITIGTSFALYQVQNKQDIVFTKVGDFSGDYIIAAYINDTQVSDFPQKGDPYAVDKIVCSNEAIGVWDYEKWGINITNTQTSGTRCNVYFVDSYQDNSGANAPVLVNNMIPVFYDGTNWKYAASYDKWYDYDNKEWANAVVLNEGVTKNVGDTITEEEIALWYVWIPRYTYTIFNGNNGSVAKQEIQIKFEKGTNSSGTVECVDNVGVSGNISETCTDTTNGSIVNGTSTYTHPAFTFGDEELTGFWVGKFEVSGSTSKITIKPNITSLRNRSVSSFFTAIQNIKTVYNISGDSHMMKNMEWGAVAYLSHSKYGMCTDGTCIYIGINNNSSFITGCGAASRSSQSSTCNAYNTETGILASSTQNVYGVYDMYGGAYEYVMGNMVNGSGSFYSSDSGFNIIPNSKYFDSYTYSTSYTTHSRGKLGDATKEILKNLNSTNGWYSAYIAFPSSSSSWFNRGGCYSNGNTNGFFSFDLSHGSAAYHSSSRAVLTTNK